MSSRPLFYMAHPVSENYQTGERGPQHFMLNVHNAERWMAWLTANDRGKVYIAPWLTEVRNVNARRLTLGYQEALEDDKVVVEHCDGLILVGGKITAGMQQELETARATNKHVIDWSALRHAPTRGYRESRFLALLLRGMTYGSN